jgi:hypothetical protein
MRFLGLGACLACAIGGGWGLQACGSRTPLDVGKPAASTPAPAPGPPAPKPLASHCAIGPSGTAAPVVAAVVGSVLSFVDERGTVTPVFHFAAAPAGQSASDAYVEARAGYVAASLVSTPLYGAAQTVTMEVVMLDLAGSVVQHGVFTSPYEDFGPMDGLFGNAGGLFVASGRFGDHHLNVDSTPTGATTWTDPYAAVFDPNPDGTMLVLKDGNCTCDLYWYDPAKGTFTASALLSATASGDFTYVQGELVWATSAPARLWKENAGGSTALALDGAWDDMTYPSLIAANGAPWVVGQTSDTHVVRIDVGGGSYTGIDLEPPAGLATFEPIGGPYTGGSSYATIDSQGNLLLGLRDASSGAMYRSADGAAWEPVGLPMIDVANAGAIEVAGTYLVYGNAVSGAPAWGTPGAGVIQGPNAQVARPASGTRVQLPGAYTVGQSGGYRVTADGGCVSFFDVHSGALTLAEATTGAVHPLGIAVDTTQEQQILAWTNVPGPDVVVYQDGYQ